MQIVSEKNIEKSYVALFRPLEWIIGTGEYTSNLNAFAKAEITRELKISLSIEEIDYYFVYDVDNIDGGKDFATMLITTATVLIL